MDITIIGSVGLNPPAIKRENKGHKSGEVNDFTGCLAAELSAIHYPTSSRSGGEESYSSLDLEGNLGLPAIIGETLALSLAAASGTEPNSLPKELEGLPADFKLMVGTEEVASGRITGAFPEKTTLEEDPLAFLITEITSGSSKSTAQSPTSPWPDIQLKYTGYFPGSPVQISDFPETLLSNQGLEEKVGFLTKDGQTGISAFSPEANLWEIDHIANSKEPAARPIGERNGEGSPGKVLHSFGSSDSLWSANSLASKPQPETFIRGLQGEVAPLVEGVAIGEGNSPAGRRTLGSGEGKGKENQGDFLLPLKPQPSVSGNVDMAGPYRLSNLGELASKLLALARWQAYPDRYELELKLKPESLGKLRVHVVLAENRLSLQLMVETPEAGRALQVALPELKQVLQTYGLKLEQIHVQVSTGQGGKGWEGPGEGRSWGTQVWPVLEVKSEEDTLQVAPARNSYRLDYLA
ncbi:hook-length control protein FliK [Thermanaeromonas toyohensis ToBE]|uniref:Hook-length control protein FliK n=1 Tax=Thermanaeromonas toyohensis ToBE TaxID=698762 RepID=A0A1W1VKW0_9FIRM|nr:flagellar hook-length control protein FliK [Thermanaeromonas toyohensis]SMB94002.1 hook-length control protein FliK [Thermanaeromonas toyohensis ToBE]